ncbi:MAG TPA: DUF4143 domain-containing protein [Acidobacteria bacterium]|nr:DUF4143 domain-containing protein [Acidobacteriota bacterium]
MGGVYDGTPAGVSARTGLGKSKVQLAFFTFLLGIRSAEQAARDPLRGNLYENLIIAEIAKGALNRGIRPELFFFRDTHGSEVDLVLRHGGALLPVEIKSAATFSPSFLKGLEWFRSLGLDRVAPGAVLFNGEERFTIRGTRVFNPLREANLWDRLTSLAGEGGEGG